MMNVLNRDCKEQFRHTARWLSRVIPDCCVLIPTKEGEIIREYLSYYDKTEWRLGKFYLVKCVLNTLEEQFAMRDTYEIDTYARFLEENLPYGVLCDLYAKIRDAMNKNHCCVRHCFWSRERSQWPTTLEDSTPVNIYDIEEVYSTKYEYQDTSGTSSSLTESDYADDDYWDMYDDESEYTENHRSYIDDLILSTEDL